MSISSTTYPQTTFSSIVHAKPLSHQIFRGVRHLGTLLVQGANPKEWRGQMRTSLAKVLVIAGYVANIVISIFETLAGLLLSTAASIIHVKQGRKSQTLQNITIKLIGYTCNALLVTATQIVCLNRRFFPEHRGMNVLVNHGLHIISFACSQFIGSLFDTMHNEEVDEEMDEEEISENEFFSPYINRTTYGLMEIYPAAVHDMMRSFSHNAAAIENNIPNPQEFANSFSRLQNDFSFENLRDPAYQQTLYQFIYNFFILPLLPTLTTQDVSGKFLIPFDKKDEEYQNSLIQHMKDAIIRLHDNESFLPMLCKETNDDIKETNDLIQIRNNLFDGFYSLQVCHYAQFLELENSITCPQAFNTSYLTKYNDRYQKLVDIQQNFSSLTKDEKDILLQKLLECGSFDLEKISMEEKRIEILKQLYSDIGDLAIQINREKLLYRYYVDENLLARGQFLESYQSESRMSEAYKEAQQFLERNMSEQNTQD